MPYIRRTGGEKEFRSNSKVDEEIRNKDTDSSKAFKVAYKQHLTGQRKQQAEKKQAERNIIWLIIILALLAILARIFGFFYLPKQSPEPAKNLLNERSAHTFS